jgi:hypothetical protein
MRDELHANDDYVHDDNNDPYGMLNFKDQIDVELDTEDEMEVRQELAKSRTGRFDGIVDVFLRLEEEYPDLELGLGIPGEWREESVEKKAEAGEVKKQKKRVKPEPLKDEEVEAPPEQKGVWSDAKWFGRMLARSIGS